MAQVQESDAAAGIRAIASPGKIDVDAQVIELSQLRPENLDPRVHVPGIERLAQSDAVHHQHRLPARHGRVPPPVAVALGVDELRGIYIMGKAATLNGRVGDVMISQGGPRRALVEHVPVPQRAASRATCSRSCSTAPCSTTRRR